MTEAYPLQWPEGWPRTPVDQQDRGSKFRTKDYSREWGTRSITFAESRDKLYGELQRLGAQHVVVSTNHKPDRYGIPTESKKRTGDDGIAVYFQLKGRSMSMACDRFDNAPANMRSLGLAIEAMRQLERHGGGQMVERAFAGFTALAAPAGREWWDILQCRRDMNLTAIEVQYKRLAHDYHPDKGGSAEKMTELNVAIAQARKEKGAA